MPQPTPKPTLIPAQRRTRILELIRQSGVIAIQDLAAAIDVSLSTIRRDLTWLAQAGSVQRSHGGAILKATPGTTFEPTGQIAASLAPREKTAIGRLAAARLQNHQSVVFDSSSTVCEAAREVLLRGLTMTAVTNDIRIAEVLASTPAVRLVVCGGTLRPGAYTLLGEPGTGFLQRLHVDVALIGIHAVSGTAFCETSTEVAQAKRLMAAAAERVIVLADSTKFGQRAFYDVFTAAEVSEVISDARLAPGTRRELERRDVKVSLAAPEPPRRGRA